jgi:DNA-binding SARP family transcriptional activator
MSPSVQSQRRVQPRAEKHSEHAAGLVNGLLRFGIIVTDSSGVVIDADDTAKQMIAAAHGRWPEDATCCSLFGCLRTEPLAHHCLSALASRSQEPLPEVRVDLPPDLPSSAVWITAARMRQDGSEIAMHLRPAGVGDRRRRTKPHWMANPHLRIRALGRTRVETEEITIEGDWLLQRPGQLLKYFVCQRGRPAHVDEIVEALWPDSGVTGRNTVRHYVHVLRDRVEPSRPRRAPSAFIVSSGSAYALDPRVDLDVDEFEGLVSAGLGAWPQPGTSEVTRVQYLEQAVSLYEGDLISEEPFAEWAFAERELMRTLAYRALSRLVEHYLERDELDAATAHLERATELRPLDDEVQRQLIVVYLRQGRHSDASRRYGTFRQRMLDEFGQEPGFSLAELAEKNGKRKPTLNGNHDEEKTGQ